MFTVHAAAGRGPNTITESEEKRGRGSRAAPALLLPISQRAKLPVPDALKPLGWYAA